MIETYALTPETLAAAQARTERKTIMIRGAELLVLTGEDCHEPEPSIPESLPARQFWTAIYDKGLLPAVQALKASLPERDRIIIDAATEFHRSHPKLLEMSAAIGVTEDQVADLFFYGATLE